MDVILLERVRNLGSLGDTVKVRGGYGRNYLIPTGKAVSATKENLSKLEARRAELEAKEAEAVKLATQRADKLNALELIIEAMASEEGKLYGSVATHEIADAIHARGFEIEKREIMLPEGPIHQLGNYEIDVLIHNDIRATVKLEIVAAK